MADRVYNAKQNYRCTYCGDRTYSLNGDQDPHFREWLELHATGDCSRHPVQVGTQADLIAAVKKGEIKGVWWDEHGGRSTRFTWKT